MSQTFLIPVVVAVADCVILSTFAQHTQTFLMLVCVAVAALDAHNVRIPRVC
jgi:hypothetical protein